MKKHILTDGTPAIKQLAGISEYTYQLLAHLGTLDHTTDYTVFTSGRNRRALAPLPNLPRNFHHLHWPMPQKLLNWSWRYLGEPRLNRFVQDIDLFFAPHFLFPAGNFRRTVIMIHDVLFLDYPDYFLPADRTYFTERLHYACQIADRILVPSSYSKDRLVAHGFIDHAKITVTHPGVDWHAATTADRKRLRETYHLPDAYLLCIGTIEPRKNILGLLEAYARLRAAGHVLPLVLAGRRGWLGAEFETMLERLNLQESVIQIGSFDRINRPALLAGAQAFVFPSFAEGFGLPVIEALAAGVPVVTSNVTSLPEVAGDAALLVDPHEPADLAAALERILTNENLAKHFREAGPRQARQFTWHKTATQTLAIFTELLQ